MENINYVTQLECEDRRKDVIDMIYEDRKDISDMKIVISELKTCTHITNSMLKAIFTVTASGLVSIIVILLTRGI